MNRRIFLQAAAALLPAKAQGQVSNPADPSNLRLCIVTMKGARWKVEENFQRMEHRVREGAKSGAQLVIAPESILDGYICCTDRHTTKEKMLAVAERVPDGVYITRARALAKELKIYLIFGFLERSGGELYLNYAQK
jgi:predicted amidohydrolase